MGEGKSTPAMEGKPILRADLAEVWEFFSELICYRQYGMSANPLLLTEISTYLDERGVSLPSRRVRIISLLKKMDITCRQDGRLMLNNFVHGPREGSAAY